MKDDINLLGKEFDEIINSCQTEEENVRKIEKEFVKLLKELGNHNKDRIEMLKSIRDKKLKEIEEELENCENQLDFLEDQKEEYLKLYCKERGHKYIITSEKLFIDHDSGNALHRLGSNFVTNCVICGDEKKDIRKTDAIKVDDEETYQKNILKEICNENLPINGVTLKKIEQEKKEIKNYIKYLKFLLAEICTIFGHDVEEFKEYNETCYKCKCCGKIMSWSEFHYKLKYKSKLGPESYEIPVTKYLISSENDLDLSLPSFESFQKTKKIKKVIDND